MITSLLREDEKNQTRLFSVFFEDLNRFAYVIFQIHPELGHLCVYLNVDHTRLSEDDINDCSYYGVGSSALSVPKEIASTLPIPLYQYWIGWDWMNRESPSVETVLDLLHSVVRLFYTVKP